MLDRKLHAQRSRKTLPFNKVDCATLPSGLIVGELCGHEKGPFTGTQKTKVGLFELAGNFVPSSIGLTSCGLRILRQRFSAIANNLKAIVRPLAREPAPFVIRCRSRTVAKADSITFVLRIDCQWAAGKS